MIIPVIFYAFWRDWHAGISWGPRFLIPFIPYWVLTATKFFMEFSLLKKILFTIILIPSCMVTVQGLLFDRLSKAISLFEYSSFSQFLSSFPYFYRLNDIFVLEKFDSFWIQQLQAGWGERSIFFILIVITCLFLGFVWFTWFKKQNSIQ